MKDKQTKRIYELRHIYLKDASFESPHAPEIFSDLSTSPGMDIDVNVQYRVLNDEKTMFENVLLLRITAKSEEKTLFLTEIAQAGIVEISGFSDQDQEQLLNIAVPNALLPFARETIASMVSKGGFPQLLIRPLNFDNIYREKLKARKEQLQDTQTKH